MSAIAISLLFGLAAFFSLLTVYLSVLCGTRKGLAILAEIARIDARYGRQRRFALPALARRKREEEFASLWPQSSAGA